MEGFLANELLQSPVASCQPRSISCSASPCNKLWLGNCGYSHTTNKAQWYQKSITFIPRVVCLHLARLSNIQLAKRVCNEIHEQWKCTQQVVDKKKRGKVNEVPLFFSVLSFFFLLFLYTRGTAALASQHLQEAGIREKLFPLVISFMMLW